MNHAAKVEIAESYAAAYNAKDLEAIVGLFAADATMEDPVGEAPAKGIEAIAALYQQGFDMGIEFEIEGEIRTAANSVAFPVCARTATSRLYIIDVFEFDDAGKIERMRAYWSRDNLVGEMDL